jgi:ligand-binding SRPBCC domain-containing protein
MRSHTLRRELWVPHPVPVVFDFFARAKNLEQLTPPWLHFKIIAPQPIQMKKGAHIQYALPFGLLGRLVHRLQVARDVARIFDYRQQKIKALFA